MTKLFIENLPISGKKILMRVDFNVPLDEDLNIIDSTRIVESLPSIRYIQNQGGAVILMSHLGRPRNVHTPHLSLKPVVKALSALLNSPVQMASDCIGEEVKKQVDALQPKDVLLLENLRFHRAEEHPEEDPSFAKELAIFGDFYVNDAFGTAHRKHSSTYFVPLLFPGKAAAGYLIEKEMHFLDALLTPKRPFYALIGGAKVSTKIGVIKSLLKKVDRLFLGGGMAYTFLRAKGYETGDSLVEEDLVQLAKELLELYPDKIFLPKDILAAKECSEHAESIVMEVSDGIKQGYQGLDIGPQTVTFYCDALKDGKTILWNGPFGVYEFERFAQGTLKLGQWISQLPAMTIAGGGDLIAALKKENVADRFTHVSTGGGATLEYIEYGTLPGIAALSEKNISYSR